VKAGSQVRHVTHCNLVCVQIGSHGSSLSREAGTLEGQNKVASNWNERWSLSLLHTCVGSA